MIRRNAALLPAYSFLLGLLALLGFAAIAAGHQGREPAAGGAAAVRDEFPNWFAGIAFAAIAIGALVPAAIMSIAAANLWTRNIYKAFISRAATPEGGGPAEQADLPGREVRRAGVRARRVGTQYAINFQLLGGVWILQTFPALVFGLYTGWFHRKALLAGWAVGMVYGTWTAYNVPAVGKPGQPLRRPARSWSRSPRPRATSPSRRS